MPDLINYMMLYQSRRIGLVETTVKYTSNNPNNLKLKIHVKHTTHISKRRNNEGEPEKRKRSPDVTVGKLRSELPSHIKGTVGKDGYPQQTHRYQVFVSQGKKKDEEKFDETYRPIPGGCHIERSVFDQCTLGYHVYDKDRERRMLLTAAHCAGSQNHQPYYNQDIGYEEQSKKENGFDAATINYRDLDFTVNGKLAENGGGYTDKSVNGIKSWDWVTNKAYEEEIYQQGSETVRTSGTLKESEPTDAGVRQIKYEDITAGGDSGGPVYYDDGDTFYLVGIHAWGTAGDTSGGTYIGEIQDQFDVIV
ncbi:trypsin-like serine protease (plasmid) [Haloarcula sp. NS06]|uniref:trypsin-like serine protease n=1 Tax=Haloarcula sp. NS06 TaxID=3409688 RepID=UPI003DA77A7A